MPFEASVPAPQNRNQYKLCTVNNRQDAGSPGRAESSPSSPSGCSPSPPPSSAAGIPPAGREAAYISPARSRLPSALASAAWFRMFRAMLDSCSADHVA